MKNSLSISGIIILLIFASSNSFGGNQWIGVPGATPSAPTLAWNPVASKLQIVVRASDDSIWTGTFNSSGVFDNDWTSIPGRTASPPALSWNPVANQIQMVAWAVPGSSPYYHCIWVASFDQSGTFNNNWMAISGNTASPPALAWNPSVNKMQMVVRGADDSIWVSSFNSTGVFNNDWAGIPGRTVSSPALAWNPVANEMLMVVRASDDSIWVASFNSAGVFNNDWTPIPGRIGEAPALAWDGSASEALYGGESF